MNFKPVFKPYAHQEIEKENWEEPFWAWFWEMGLGKSKALIDNACYLFSNNCINGLLILAPKGTYLNWIFNELPTHLPSDLKTRCAYWNASAPAGKRKIASQLCENIQPDCLDILCVNLEAIRSERGLKVCEIFLRRHTAMMAIDESTAIKSDKSIQKKNACLLGQMADYRRIMTGTPITQSPLDIWGQAEFLKPGLLGYKNFFVFKANHAVEREITMGTRRFRKIVGFQDLNILSSKIDKFSTRLTKEECLDLPKKIWNIHSVEQTKEQRRAYNELLKEAFTLLADEETVTTQSALTTLMRLHQINCGHVMSDNGKIANIKSNRIDALLEIVEDREDDIIIWGTFQRDIWLIQEALTKKYGKESTVTYFGPNTQKEREKALDRFKNDKECRFIVGTPAAMGRGLTLTNSSFTIYYSLGYPLEPFLQSQDRNHRIGQTKAVNYVNLVIPGTVDEKVYKALRAKKNIADSILDNWRQLFATNPT